MCGQRSWPRCKSPLFVGFSRLVDFRVLLRAGLLHDSLSFAGPSRDQYAETDRSRRSHRHVRSYADTRSQTLRTGLRGAVSSSRHLPRSGLRGRCHLRMSCRVRWQAGEHGFVRPRRVQDLS